MSDAPGNVVYGDLDACLHCAVWALIERGAPKTGSGEPIYNATEIITNLAEVIAEVIASHARERRRQILRQFPAELRDLVARKVASGEHPKGAPAGVLAN
jgi:hypothetical protein